MSSVWFEINILNRIGIFRISGLSQRVYSRRFWRGIDSNRIFSSDSNWIWSSDSEPIDVKNTKTTLMLNHPAISRQSVNLPKINDRDLVQQFESNLDSTEELCKKIKTSIVNLKGQLIKVKFINNVSQDTRNLFSRLYTNYSFA